MSDERPDQSPVPSAVEMEAVLHGRNPDRADPDPEHTQDVGIDDDGTEGADPDIAP